MNPPAVNPPAAPIRVDRLWPLVEHRAQATPHGEMVVDETGNRLTFGQFRIRAERVAAALAQRGVGAGTAVSWQFPTTIEALVLTAALARLGAVQNPIMPTYGGRDLGFVLEQSGTQLFVVASEWAGRDLAGPSRKVADEFPGLDVLVVDGSLPEADGPAPLAEQTGEDVRWIFYTSGTTSVPKGVRHTDVSMLASSRSLGDHLRLTPSDRVGMVFPIAHLGGCGSWLGAAMTYGLTLIIDAAFDPVRTTELQRREGVTLAGTAAVFTQIYQRAQRSLPPGERLFPRLRAIMSGAAPKTPNLHAEIRREMGGIGILSGYGMTEAPNVAVSTPDDSDAALSSAEGRVCGGVDLRIVDADGRVLDLGEVGEIRLKAPQVMRGYVDPSLDADVFDDEGYLRSGDLGSLDDAGNLTIRGRLKDVIIRKGENISARAIEEHLAGHPAIQELTVIGLPHPDLGEVACVVAVPASGATAPTLDDLTAYLAEQEFPKRQWPERLELVDAIPRNPTGKIRKDVLRRQIGAEPAVGTA